jgi:hypothetical protein
MAISWYNNGLIEVLYTVVISLLILRGDFSSIV